MNRRLGVDEAQLFLVKHLADTPRAAHSRFVGAMMAALARRLGADIELWHITGLLHDIDYPTTFATPDRHGPLAAEWLAARLPEAALLAIAAHDHRAGIVSDTPIAAALKLADAIAVLEERAGRSATVEALQQGADALRGLAGERGYLAQMILDFSARLDLTLPELAGDLRALRPQAPRAPAS